MSAATSTYAGYAASTVSLEDRITAALDNPDVDRARRIRGDERSRRRNRRGITRAELRAAKAAVDTSRFPKKV